jgi:hypothetical protein
MGRTVGGSNNVWTLTVISARLLLSELLFFISAVHPTITERSFPAGVAVYSGRNWELFGIRR